MDTESLRRYILRLHYNNIKKVYSIWICMDAPEYAQNTITEYSIQQNKLYGDYRGNARYDLMSVVMICLGDSDAFAKDDNEYQKLINLLTLLSSHKVPPVEKLAKLDQDYHIATTRKLREGFNSMCNWSEGIIDRITKEVTEDITAKVTKEVTAKVTEEVTAEVEAETREDSITSVMASLGVSFEKACEILRLNATDFAALKEKLIKNS